MSISNVGMTSRSSSSSTRKILLIVVALTLCLLYENTVAAFSPTTMMKKLRKVTTNHHHRSRYRTLSESLPILVLLRAASTKEPTTVISPRGQRLPPSRGVSAVDSEGKAGEEEEQDEDRWILQSLHRQAGANEDGPAVIGPARVLVFDTTLRDGTQGESISASADDKLKIARRLSGFDVDYIEAGWPGSNPKDAEFFDRARTELDATERSKLVAFGSTRRKRCAAKDDPQVKALLAAETPTVCLVAKSHPWHVTEILRATLDENLDMIRDTVQYLKSRGRRVMVDLEHFFDGYAANPGYALACCEAAADAGASCLVLCDTNGGTMPWVLGEMTADVVQHFDGLVTVGIHCHNDCGMAVANSCTAVNSGAGMVQGTVNGIGERTGNADLCSIIPSLALHAGSDMSCGSRLANLTSVSHYVDEILNRTPDPARPFVGASAFAHKGGLHVAAMERSPLSYQHVEPELVGNERRTLISELSGRQNILGKIRETGAMSHMRDDEDELSQRAVAILNHVKRLESRGYTFEGAEASVHLMILHACKGYCSPFRVLDYSVHIHDVDLDSASRVILREQQGNEDDGNEGKSSRKGKDGSRSDRRKSSNNGPTARATVKVLTMEQEEWQPEVEHNKGRQGQEDNGEEFPQVTRLEVCEGNGPVDALAGALMKALQPSHPFLETVELKDYKVRILDPESATSATTRVMIEFHDSKKDATWTTVSADTNIISASLNALIDGFEYALIEYGASCMLCDDDYY